jgi:Ni,Fe-hydrogenase III small subunit
MTDGVFTARFILFGLVVAQLADAFTFTYGVARFGIHLESNGIAAGIFHLGGLDAVLLVKGAVIVATTVLLAYTAHRFPRLLVWGGATATSMGLLGFAANSASIAVLS